LPLGFIYLSKTEGAALMSDLKSRVSVSLLLLAVLWISLFSIQSVNSESATITTTTTINQPPPGQCSEIALAFSGQSGREVWGTFGSDASVSFYIVSPSDLTAIRNSNCRLPSSSRPLYSETNVVGYDNPYRSLPFPADGVYYFVFVLGNSGPSQLLSGFANIQLTYPPSTIFINAETASATITASSSMNATALSTALTNQGNSNSISASNFSSTNLSFGVWGVTGLIVAIGVVTSVLVFVKRGKLQIRRTAQRTTVTQEAGHKALLQAPGTVLTPAEQNISVGYPELDTILAGGLPVGFAVLIVSPPCDERDLLFRKIIESILSMDGLIFFLSRELGKTQDFAARYRKGFYVLSPQADKIIGQPGNIVKIQSVQNLYDLNISFTKAVETMPKTSSVKLIIIDLLSDILLEHKALTTRKWLDDFIAKRKGEGFTILAVLNPLITSQQETQTIMDLFDGLIEIYEKEMKERTRRFLIVKKMYGRKYIETEVMLDRDKLFESAISTYIER
jgi:archaellum biogenesis ATPase FlaH